MHRPQVLFLDEPTSGLDPQSAQAVHALLRRLAREEGTTCFLCTHQLRYAQEICTCYGLMDQGGSLPRAPWTSPGPGGRGRDPSPLQAGGRPSPSPRPDRGAEIPIAGEEGHPRPGPPGSGRRGERSPGSSPRPPRWRTSTSTSSVRERRLCHEPRYACPDPKGPPIGHRQPPDAGDPAGGPLVLTVFLPTVAVVTLHTAPEEAADFQKAPGPPPGGRRGRAWSGRS